MQAHWSRRLWFKARRKLHTYRCGQVRTWVPCILSFPEVQLYTGHHTCGLDWSTRIVQVAPDAHEQETRVKRDGVGWDDHPAAGFESALLRIALAIEMQRYLWMPAEVERTRQQSSGCRNTGARVRISV